MEDVKDLSVELEKWHKYKPVYKIEFTKNGKRISFSKSYSYPSVFVIIFNKTCQKLVLVKQWPNFSVKCSESFIIQVSFI